jgi:hypothetical protein
MEQVNSQVRQLCEYLLGSRNGDIPDVAESLQADKMPLFDLLKRGEIEDRLDIVLSILPDWLVWKIACDFAFRTLSVWESVNHSDHRPRHAIETRIRWLSNDVSLEELALAHRLVKASCDPYIASDLYAACSAAEVVSDPALAAAAASSSAAYAARITLGESEREWQMERIKSYLSQYS